MKKKTFPNQRKDPGKGSSILKPALFLLLACSFCLFSGNIAETRADLKKSSPAPSRTETLNKVEIMAKVTSISVPFVKNVGQFNSEVKYAADLFGGRFFLTDKELVYSLIKRSGKKNAKQDKHRLKADPDEKMPSKGLAFKEFFINKKRTKINFKSSGEQQAATKVSYFKGNDPSKWRSGVASYQSVSLGQVYPGIEVKLKASGKNMEKIFYVSPQTNVGDIKIGVAGISGLEIANDGQLLLKNSLGELSIRSPIAWQEIDGQSREVKVNYRLLGKKYYGFAISGDYNKNHVLVIDPELDTLLASTFLGGSGGGGSSFLALDSSGNVYVTGATDSADFPTTPGAFDRTLNGSNAFISKLDSNLTTLLASTFLGGSSSGKSLALDSAGNVYLTGSTTSSDFPTTPNAFDQTKNGGYDVFISKLDSNLTTLLASTYLGGNSSWAFANSLVLDSSSNVFVTGLTNSMDFPTTPGTFDQTANGSSDVFISKLNSDLTVLLASTYLGGIEEDSGTSLALDSIGNVYITGYTGPCTYPTSPGVYDGKYADSYDIFVSKLNKNSNEPPRTNYINKSEFSKNNSLKLGQMGDTQVNESKSSNDFPTTPGAYDRTYNDSNYIYADAFISKLNNDLSTLLASTYLGWEKLDEGNSLALDHMGNVYITGESNYSVFISKLNGDLTMLLASIFLNGERLDFGKSLALDGSTNVYVFGFTNSTDFPTTPGAYDRTYNHGYSDTFVAKLNSDLSELLASTHLGGSGEEWCESLALDSSGNVFVTGFASSKDFPTTPGAFDQTNDCAEHRFTAFISKLGNSFNVKLDLQAERRQIKSFSMVRDYGLIQFTVDDAGIPVAEYRLYHRAGDGPYSLIRTILPHELQNNQFQMQDKYLDKGAQYTYIVEAYNSVGQLVGRSSEKTI